MRARVSLRATAAILLVLAAATVPLLTTRDANTARAAHDAVPRFDHAVVVVFENHSEAQVLGSRKAPTFRRLAERYAELERFDAVAHPSLPNYLALVAGSTFGIGHDCVHCVVDGRSLAATLAARRLTWKAYVEGLPANLDRIHRRSVKARIPFLFFRGVLSHRSQLRSIVPLRVLSRDLARGELPSFSLVVPNLCHDMHGCPVGTGDRWLRSFLTPLLRAPAMRRGVVFVIFDEGRRHDRAGGGGHVAALVLGPLVRRDAVSNATLSDYSLLRTIEDAWRLPLLGRTDDAQPITGIWRRRRGGSA